MYAPQSRTAVHVIWTLTLPLTNTQHGWCTGRQLRTIVWIHLDRRRREETRLAHREQQLLVGQQRRPPVALIALAAGSAVA